MCCVNASGDPFVFIWWPVKHFLHCDVVLEVSVCMPFFLLLWGLNRKSNEVIVGYTNDNCKGSLKCGVWM